MLIFMKLDYVRAWRKLMYYVKLHILITQIYNLKNLLSIRSGNSTIDYLNIDEINYMICHICTE